MHSLSQELGDPLAVLAQPLGHTFAGGSRKHSQHYKAKSHLALQHDANGVARGIPQSLEQSQDG